MEQDDPPWGDLVLLVQNHTRKAFPGCTIFGYYALHTTKLTRLTAGLNTSFGAVTTPKFNLVRESTAFQWILTRETDFFKNLISSPNLALFDINEKTCRRKMTMGYTKITSISSMMTELSEIWK